MVVGEYVGAFAKEAQAFEQQIAEIAGIEFLKPRLIGGIKGGAFAACECKFARRHLIGCQPTVLPTVDKAGELAGGPAVLVDVGRLDHLLQQADLVVDIQDCEAGFQPDEFGMAAQDLDAD